MRGNAQASSKNCGMVMTKRQGVTLPFAAVADADLLLRFSW
jgi:hypothetical protein